jgi:hypothetical protein
MGRSRRLSKGKSQTKMRIYRAYYSETEYDWLLAESLEEAKSRFSKEFPDKTYLKIKLKG